MVENISNKYDVTGKDAEVIVGLGAKSKVTKKEETVKTEDNWYSYFAGMSDLFYTSKADDTAGAESSIKALVAIEDQPWYVSQTKVALEDDNLVGRFDGQRGYVGTDTSSAVADALIGNSVVHL